MLFPKKHSFLDFLYKNVYPTIKCTFKQLISVLVMQKTINIYMTTVPSPAEKELLSYVGTYSFTWSR